MSKVCPKCLAGDSLATIEDLQGLALLDGVSDDGPDYSGTTEIIWDSSVTTGIYCSACDWEHKGSDWEDRLKKV